MNPAPKEFASFWTPVVVSPDGEWLASPLDFASSGVKLIKFSNAELDTRIIDGDRRPISLGDWSPTLLFSPDGKMISVAGFIRPERQLLEDWLPAVTNPFPLRKEAEIVRVWDTESGRQIAAFDNCSGAWFSPDGRVLATLREDGKAINLWRIPFRVSLWHVFCQTLVVWLVVVLIGLFGAKIRTKAIRC